MKIVRYIFFLVAISSCSEKKPYVSDRTKMNKMIIIRGQLDDGYYKTFPFSVKGQHQSYGLDVVNLPDHLLGSICDVKGEEKVVEGIRILTKVSINGVRYQTPLEWRYSNANPDPFSNLGP
jgi:hypothetical protein